MLVEACGAVGESSAAGTFAATDGGFPDGGAPPDSAGDAPAFAPTTALIVQASPSLPDVRLCWAIGGSVSPGVPFPGVGSMPGSNYPGIPLGGVGAMSDATALVGTDVVLYAVDARSVAQIGQQQTQPVTCDALICGQGTNPAPPCFGYDTGYWPVQTLAGASVQRGKNNVIALTGCLPTALDPDASTALCGASWNAVGGNLHADVLQLVTTTSTGPIAVQAAQLSPGLVTLEGEGGTTAVSFGAQGASDASSVATLEEEGDLSAPSSVTIGPGLPVYGQLGFAVDVAAYDGGAGHLWMSLADSQQLVNPTADPTQFFGQPRTYLVAVLGDPTAPHAFAPAAGDAGYDGKGLHILVVAAPATDAGEASGGDL
jgi:hypothetical protein